MKLKTIDIRGTAYVTVNSRLKYFRENFPNYQLISEVLSNQDGKCLIKAGIINEKGVVVATGHAYEVEGVGPVNKTSHVENCETSAWGRALGNFGIGIDAAVASYEEVANAIEQRKPVKKRVKESVSAETETIKNEDLETMLEDCQDIQEVVELWWLLTKDQQTTSSIAYWFKQRKSQLQGETNG